MTSPFADIALLWLIAKIMAATIAGALALLFMHAHYLYEEAGASRKLLTPFRRLLPAMLEGVLNKSVVGTDANMLGVVKDFAWDSDGEPALVVVNEDLQSSFLLPFSAERKVGDLIRIGSKQKLATTASDYSSGTKLLFELPERFQIALFTDFGRIISGEEKRNLRSLAENTGLLASTETGCMSSWWWQRLHSLRLLSVLGAGETVGFSMLSDENPMVRAQAAQWASDHPEPEIIGRLLELLGDPESLCRFHVEDSLSRMGTIVVDPMVGYLNTHGGREVEEALKVCVGIPSPQFLGSALSLTKHEKPAVRVLASELLGSIGGDQAVEALRKLFKDTNAEVRATAVSAVGKLHYWSASSELADMLGDPDWHVRRNAGYALRAVGPPGILVLGQSVNSKNELVAEMARAALEFSDIAAKGQFT
jgi:hypothetical protein